MWVLLILLILVVLAVLFLRWLFSASAPSATSNAGQSRIVTARQTTRAATKPVEAASMEDIDIPVGAIDLRELPSKRLAVVGVSNYMTDRARTNRAINTWVMTREPQNKHDSNAIAVHLVGGKKAGYVSAAQARTLAPLLDELGTSFIVKGIGSAGTTSTRLWIDLPTTPALRSFVNG